MSGMELRSSDASSKDAQNKLNEEECALDTEHR